LGFAIYHRLFIKDFSQIAAPYTNSPGKPLNFDWGIAQQEFFDHFDQVGLTAGVTGQQRMLTPPRHLILPSHLSEVRVALHLIL
jgi:hypothetical protein